MILRHFVIRASPELEKENKYIRHFNRGKITDWELVKVKTESETDYVAQHENDERLTKEARRQGA